MTQRAKEAFEKDIIILYDGQHCQHDEGATQAQQLPTKTTNFNPTNELTDDFFVLLILIFILDNRF